ncbi:MAG: nucleoside/nucleotide kinase family protein [Streptomycetaceae bacterium]|nr:MAG: nucleoside/nucleotide kinase family protein [Streptomycetaceae bacterium]
MAIELSSLEAALERILHLTKNSDGRVIIGLIGKPGAGKSTLSSYLIKNLPKETTALVPMDGYHLSNAKLKILGRTDRKGAPDTFDAKGYVELLKRIKANTNDEIYFPIFHRDIEESIAAEGVVHPHTTLVLTEGNYLLLEGNGWAGVADSLTESWFVDVNNDKRMARLVARHVKYGKSPEDAHAWANGTDQRNAELIETTRMKAGVIVHLD